MAMIKRGKTGSIKKVATGAKGAKSLDDLGMEWNSVVIKDVLDVPVNYPDSIDVDLDGNDDDDDIIAKRC